MEPSGLHETPDWPKSAALSPEFFRYVQWLREHQTSSRPSGAGSMASGSPSSERACGETASRSRETEGRSSVGTRSLDDRLILSRRSGKNVLKPGASAIFSPPLAFGQLQGPNAWPRLTQIIVCAQLSRFRRRCDVARTLAQV